MKYGVRRNIKSPTDKLERLWDSVGLNALPSTEKEKGANDFDSIYPWNAIKKCNLKIENGKATAIAYEGDAAFKLDGSNGPVAVEIPKFYVPARRPGDGYEYWGVSKDPEDGWVLAPAFKTAGGKEFEYCYVAAYEISLGKDGKATSASGNFPLVEKTLSELRSYAKETKAQVFDVWQMQTIEELFATEFATLNAGSVMAGACQMAYSNAEEDAFSKVEGGNKVTTTPAHAAQFSIGQTVGIGLKRGRNQITKACLVTDVNQQTGEITFDGPALPIEVGQFIYTQGWICGCTDNVIGSTGSVESNTDKRHPMKYRGIENLWGSLYDWVDGVFVKDYEVFVCEDPAKYADEPTADYIKLSYTTAKANGFPTTLGYDEKVPFLNLPTETAEERADGMLDFLYQGEGCCTLRIGGHWGTAKSGGLFSYAPCSPMDYQGTAITSRLAWR